MVHVMMLNFAYGQYFGCDVDGMEHVMMLMEKVWL